MTFLLSVYHAQWQLCFVAWRQCNIPVLQSISVATNFGRSWRLLEGSWIPSESSRKREDILWIDFQVIHYAQECESQDTVMVWNQQNFTPDTKITMEQGLCGDSVWLSSYWDPNRNFQVSFVAPNLLSSVFLSLLDRNLPPLSLSLPPPSLSPSLPPLSLPPSLCLSVSVSVGIPVLSEEQDFIRCFVAGDCGLSNNFQKCVYIEGEHQYKCQGKKDGRYIVLQILIALGTCLCKWEWACLMVTLCCSLKFPRSWNMSWWRNYWQGQIYRMAAYWVLLLTSLDTSQ